MPGSNSKRVVSVDADYLFTITQRVTNNSGDPISISPYSRVQRFDTPDTLGFYILHEGPYGVFEETLQEHDYDDLSEDGEVREESTGGWLGFTDKYWLVALIPDQGAAFTGQFAHRDSSGRDRYLATMQRTDAETVFSGSAFEQTSHLYAGAKVVQTIERYGEELGIQRFDLTVDWGWFHFLTRPFFYALAYINGLVGNFGVAILILTVAIKLVLFPLANKSYRSMAKMKALAPEMQKLKERFGEDRQKLNQEMMALYKREKANPASGCLPILVQIPVFFALYKVLFVTIEMRHAPFFGWIQDLSARDPTSMFNLFGLLPFTPPEFLLIGAWPLIMGLTMWLQQKLNPAPTDPIQQKIFAFLPIIFTVMLAAFPAGLVIYWAWNNFAVDHPAIRHHARRRREDRRRRGETATALADIRRFAVRQRVRRRRGGWRGQGAAQWRRPPMPASPPGPRDRRTARRRRPHRHRHRRNGAERPSGAAARAGRGRHRAGATDPPARFGTTRQR